jgi:polysaccharide chain length determinant protein (PEP-CTERM system associated)
MIPGKAIQARDLLNILRRPSAIVVPFVLITATAVPIIRLLPNKYRSETLIMVVPQRVPESYVKSTVTSRIEDRLRSINQQITSRSRLEPIINEFDLYPEETQNGLVEDVIERMRDDIRTQIIRSDAFHISYVSRDAATAMKVTERLAAMYIDESLRDREVLAESTNQFLDSQLADAKGRLLAHEKKLESFKTRYSGQLPTQVQANLQVMQNAQLQIQSIVDSLNRDRDRRLLLQGQLADLGGTTTGGEGDSTEVLSPSAGPGEADPVTAARKTLEQLLQRRTPSHPDVVRQQRIVAELEKGAADQANALALLPPKKRMVASGDVAEIARRARVDQIRNELEALGRQIEQKEQDEARLRGVVDEYQRRVEAAPARESELTELMRDYDTLQHSYTTLLAKKEDAQVSANLERHQVGEQFKILDPARMPEKPFSPNRRALYALSAAVGLGAGLLLAGFMEYRDTSLKTDDDVVGVLKLPVLAMIPELSANETQLTKERRRSTVWLVVAAGAALVVVAIFVQVWGR